MPTVKELEGQIKDLSQKALEVVDGDQTMAEKKEALDKIEPEIKSLTEQRDDQKHLEEQRARFQGNIDAGADPDPDPDPAKKEVQARSIGEQFVASAAYKDMLERQLPGSKGLWTSQAVEIKAATMTETASPVIQPELKPGVTMLGFQVPRVADLMPNGTTNSNTVRYLKETTATNAADTVAEEGEKPESTLVLAEVDESVRKIATLLKVTDEMLEDYAQTRSYIDGRLGFFVRLAEDDQLLNGSGTPPDLTGILNRSGKQTAQALGADTRPDAVYKQITNIRANAFVEPDGLVIHPTDWQDFRLAKDGNQQYYAGGPFYGPYGNGNAAGEAPNLWGLRVIVTSRIAAGTALVGAFATCAQVFRKGGLRLDATNSHDDDFAFNRTAIRAEERVALAVYRPGGFGTVTGL